MGFLSYRACVHSPFVVVQKSSQLVVEEDERLVMAKNSASFSRFKQRSIIIRSLHAR